MLNFAQTFGPATTTHMLRIWPDGTVVSLDDMREGDYNHMSDDYEDVDAYNLPQHIRDDAQLADAISEEMSGFTPPRESFQDWLARHAEDPILDYDTSMAADHAVLAETYAADIPHWMDDQYSGFEKLLWRISLIRSNYRFLDNESRFMTSASFKLPLHEILNNAYLAVRNALKGKDVAW